MIIGLAVGIVSFCGPLYLSEISPKEKRGQIVSLHQLAITFGILFSYLTNYLCANLESNWRVMFLIGVVPAFILFFGLLWMLPIKILLNIPSYRDYDISDILYRYVIGFDNGHLWFLYALFTIFVILYAFNRVLIKRKWGCFDFDIMYVFDDKGNKYKCI